VGAGPGARAAGATSTTTTRAAAAASWLAQFVDVAKETGGSGFRAEGGEIGLSVRREVRPGGGRSGSVREQAAGSVGVSRQRQSAASNDERQRPVSTDRETELAFAGPALRATPDATRARSAARRPGSRPSARAAESGRKAAARPVALAPRPDLAVLIPTAIRGPAEQETPFMASGAVSRSAGVIRECIDGVCRDPPSRSNRSTRGVFSLRKRRKRTISRGIRWSTWQRLCLVAPRRPQPHPRSCRHRRAAHPGPRAPVRLSPVRVR